MTFNKVTLILGALLVACPVTAGAKPRHAGHTFAARRANIGHSKALERLGNTTQKLKGTAEVTSDGRSGEVLEGGATSIPANSSNPKSVTLRKNATAATAWIPVSNKKNKVRGVNTGSLFVFEPWMASDEWQAMGCGASKAEWDCVELLGQETANEVFAKHWNTWYNKTDFTEMARLGLNTVRVPLGYWTVESEIADGDHYPRGSWQYVRQICRWAKEAGLYVVLELHALPGGSTPWQAFAGQWLEPEELRFYGNMTNFRRAWNVLSNWTTEVHTHADFSSVAAIGVMNEPLKLNDKIPATGLLDVYYPGALKAIRDAEVALGITCDPDDSYACLGVQYMTLSWYAGNPTTYLPNTSHVLFDDHDYVRSIVKDEDQTRKGYMQYSCNDVRNTQLSPTLVGEFSLRAQDRNDLFKNMTGATEFYRNWATAQFLRAEKDAGWLFWSWKQEKKDVGWSYYESYLAGYIPEDLDALDPTVCDEYRTANLTSMIVPGADLTSMRSP